MKYIKYGHQKTSTKTFTSSSEAEWTFVVFVMQHNCFQAHNFLWLKKDEMI